MINVFKALNPLNIFWLFIVLIVSRAVYIYHAPANIPFAFGTTFSRLLILGNLQYPFSAEANIVLAAVIVFVQSLLLNYIVNHFNLLGKPTLLPALMYITLSTLFTPFLVLTPELFCNFLLIWILFKLFSLYKIKDAKPTTYDMGLIIGLGTLIYIPFIYLFLLIFIGLTIFRPIIWREFLTAIIGFLTILFFLVVYYYLNDKLDQLYNVIQPNNIKLIHSLTLGKYNLWVLLPVCIILILCLLKIQQNFFRSYVQVRKSFQLIFIVFLLTLSTFYLNDAFNWGHFILCAVPGAVLFAYYFSQARLKWFYESLYLILFASLVYFQFNTF
jgi:hypothetical protein